MSDLIVNNPQTRILSFLSKEWSWVDVELLQHRLDVSSLGFLSFLEEMAGKNLIEINEDKTKVRYARPDYGIWAQIKHMASLFWYPVLAAMAFIGVLLFGLSNTWLGITLVIGAFFSGPIYTMLRRTKSKEK